VNQNNLLFIGSVSAVAGLTYLYLQAKEKEKFRVFSSEITPDNLISSITQWIIANSSNVNEARERYSKIYQEIKRYRHNILQLVNDKKEGKLTNEEFRDEIKQLIRHLVAEAQNGLYLTKITVSGDARPEMRLYKNGKWYRRIYRGKNSPIA